MIEKRGRGRPNKAEVLRREEAEAAIQAFLNRSDEEILADQAERFAAMNTLIDGILENHYKALTITGGPGLGKTFTSVEKLELRKLTHGIHYEHLSGGISAVNLYKKAYLCREAGSVLLLDDIDGIYRDEESLNILKKITDSSHVCTVSWLKESSTLEDNDIPNSFVFKGSVIAISNQDFDKAILSGSKFAVHLEALRSRSMFIDLRMHTLRERCLRIMNVVKTEKIFEKAGLTFEQGQSIIEFIKKHREEFVELSLRTVVVKLIPMVKTTQNWTSLARMTLLKPY
jgi:hypothetical protein